MASVFYISWIFIGNFILLNLFLAILLDSFLEEDEEGDESDYYERQKAKAHKRMLKNLKKQKNIVIMGNFKKSKQAELSKMYFGQAKGDSEEDLEDLDEDVVMKIFKDQGFMKKDQSESKKKEMYVGVDCEQSFFILGKKNRLRIICYNLITHGLWDNAVLGLICASSLKLVFDTFFDETTPDIQVQIFNTIDKIFNYAFLFEMLIKMCAIGFIMDDGSYLRESWN